MENALGGGHGNGAVGSIRNIAGTIYVAALIRRTGYGNIGGTGQGIVGKVENTLGGG
jgi:hypothetical protein